MESVRWTPRPGTRGGRLKVVHVGLTRELGMLGSFDGKAGDAIEDAMERWRGEQAETQRCMSECLRHHRLELWRKPVFMLRQCPGLVSVAPYLLETVV